LVAEAAEAVVVAGQVVLHITKETEHVEVVVKGV
jgi:hypothetical protein